MLYVHNNKLYWKKPDRPFKEFTTVEPKQGKTARPKHKRSYSRIAPEVKEEIRRLWADRHNNGYTQLAIAEKFGLNRSTVFAIIHH